MRKLLISKLDYKQRQWFFKAALRMIIADKTIAPAEVEDLKDSLKQCAGKDMDDLKAIFTSTEFAKPLTPLKSIPFENAFIILTEIARLAAIDSKFVLEEEDLLREIFSQLNFQEEGIEKLLVWTRKLALVNKEEEQLKKELETFYGP